MNGRPFYITTAIDYANGVPHVGHALEKVGADVIARYRRLRGDRVLFLIGMDEHGEKVAETAAGRGLDPLAWTGEVVEAWQEAWQQLNISHTDFIRTTEPRHRRAVEEMIRRMQAKGDLYLDTYAGYYCVGCEAYKTEDELVDGRCPHHPNREIQWMEEEDWFFRLSAYQQPLLDLLTEDATFVQPAARRNEVRRMVEDIKDISVSRSLLKWGIPWPGDEARTVYVWIDALTNYLSATGFPSPAYRDAWPAALHVIGKDIVRFHCVYWPAMLMSAGVELPRQVWAHGFMTLEGRKISKSAGVFVAPAEAAERHGTDALRYYLMREIPWDGDGNFSWERFDARYASELANDLGNLASRTLSMVARYRDATVPEGARTSLDTAIERAIADYTVHMDAYQLQPGLKRVLSLVSEANAFVEQQAPWKLARDPSSAATLNDTLTALVRGLGVVAVLLLPFMPGKMHELWTRVAGDRTPPELDVLASLDPTGWTVRKGAALFPRAELAA